MLYKEKNEYGIISLDEILIEQIINDALAPYKGSVYLAYYRGTVSDIFIRMGNFKAMEEKIVRLTEDGLYVKLFLMVKLGTPLRSTLEDIVQSVARRIKEELEIEVDNVVAVVTAMYSKQASKRNIVVKYNAERD